MHIYKNIKDIQIGDIIKGETQNNQVIDIEKPDLGSRLLYSFNDGPYFVTEEHPFKTKDGWKSINPKATYDENHRFREDLSQLQIGDEIITESGIIKIKSIKWESSENQTVYNLILSGDNTYYADDYLVHNKNYYVGVDKKQYSSGTLRSEIKDWNKYSDEAPEDARTAIIDMQNEFLGVVAPEEEGGEGEEEGEGAVGGKLGEAERALDEALNKFAQDTAASKAGLEKAGRGLGAGLKKQQTELTSMIGKTNLAQAGQRQQEELNETVMDQLSEATTEKEVAMGEAATAKTEAVAEHEGAMTDIQVKYDQGIKDLLDNLEDSTGKSAFTERYDTTKGTISDNSEGYYRSGTDVWSKSGSGQDNDTFINTFESINLESFLSDPQNPQMDTKTIITKKIKNDPGPRFNPWGPVEKDEYSYFDNIRTKKNSCFIGSTQILMGDSNE